MFGLFVENRGGEAQAFIGRWVEAGREMEITTL
jgi:hypothetical protein